MSMDTDRTRLLNDQLRQHGYGGRTVMTPSIAALGADAVKRLVQTLAIFDDFCRHCDPRSEHDFGVFDFDGVDVAFKIDYFPKDRSCPSPNPADPVNTERVITVMLAEEY